MVICQLCYNTFMHSNRSMLQLAGAKVILSALLEEKNLVSGIVYTRQ